MINKFQILPVLPLRGLVVFPKMLIHFDVGRSISIKAIEKAIKDDQLIVLIAQKNLKMENVDFTNFYSVGTVCKVRQLLKLQGDNARVLVEGQHRCLINSFTDGSDLILANVEIIENIHTSIIENKKEATIRVIKDNFKKYLSLNNGKIDNIPNIIFENDISYICDFVIQNMLIGFETKQSILEEITEYAKAKKVIKILKTELDILKIENDINEKTQNQIDKNQKEYFLREQLRVIQNELSENQNGLPNEIYLAESYYKKFKKLKIDKQSLKKIFSEIEKISKMSFMSQESSLIKTYLDTILELPWNKKTNDNFNINDVEKQLNNDHYGLSEIKERILDFIAVKKHNKKQYSQILCLVGPPGVGKTSIAKSIAKSMNRHFSKVSLGGVRDEADIRGHRKTYIGAMPGRIINSIKTSGVKNPVILLDEIDKMSNDYRGEPSSAMLEVLDIEQNSTFRDHYLEIPFDLSDIFFICTANDINNIPMPLLDRMEIIELSSYTIYEKIQIFKKHILPKQCKIHNIENITITINNNMIIKIIEDFTREAGVRKLEQMIAKICRKIVRLLLNKKIDSINLNKIVLNKFLGEKKFFNDVPIIKNVGTVNGLAWTSVGGEILQVEVSILNGTGQIQITGNLGNVMQESVKTAISYVRSIADNLKIDNMFYKKNDIHIHFPEAATPKDGPSAGIAITTALISALLNQIVNSDIAMTGEISLHGQILAIGGLKEKIMAAFKFGIKKIFLPKSNMHNINELDNDVKKSIDFKFVENMHEIIEIIFAKQIT